MESRPSRIRSALRFLDSSRKTLPGGLRGRSCKTTAGIRI